MDINDAFEFLIDALRQEQANAKKEITILLERNNFNSVRESTIKAEKIQALFDELINLRKKWDYLLLSEDGERRVSLPLKAAEIMWNNSLPAKEHHDLKLSNNERSVRASTGKKTHQKKYRVPILKALVEMGGNARVSRVLDRVGVLMADILNDFDRKMLPTGKEIRWRNTAMWERNNMKKEGLLANNSPAGSWAITDKGRRYLQEHQ